MRAIFLLLAVLLATGGTVGCMRGDSPKRIPKAKPVVRSKTSGVRPVAGGQVVPPANVSPVASTEMPPPSVPGDDPVPAGQPVSPRPMGPAPPLPTDPYQSTQPIAGGSLNPPSPVAPPSVPPVVDPPFVVPPNPTTILPPDLVLPPQPPHRRETFRLKLASGREIDVGGAMMQAKSLVETRLREVIRGDNVLRANHANGRPQVLVCRTGATLRGPTASFRDDGRPMTYVMYDRESQRHGAVLTWADNGRPLVFEQYDAGRRDGLRCLFKPCSENCPEGHLWLVEEWSRGELSESHLVDPQGAVRTYAASRTGALPRPDDLREAGQELDEFEKQFAVAEQQLRTTVAQVEQYQRQLEQYQRQMIAQARMAAILRQRQAVIAQIQSALTAQASALASMRAATVRACGSG
jgi:hypothetical protein